MYYCVNRTGLALGQQELKQPIWVAKNPLACWTLSPPQDNRSVYKVELPESTSQEDLVAVRKFCVIREIPKSDLNAFSDTDYVCVAENQVGECFDQTGLAFGSSTLSLSGKSRGYAFDKSVIYVDGHTILECWDETTVIALGNSRVYAHGKCVVTIAENARLVGPASVFCFPYTFELEDAPTRIFPNSFLGEEKQKAFRRRMEETRESLLGTTDFWGPRDQTVTTDRSTADDLSAFLKNSGA